METRKNTLKIVFATGAKVPSYLEVLKFMSTGVKVPATDVHSVYKDENDQKFYIKFMDESSYNRFCNSVEEQYWFRYDDGSRSPVQMELASRQFKYIRLFNLPPETEDKDIAIALSKFGKIRQHVREKYPQDLGYHVFSGIRGVYMEVEKEIPANMYIAHFRARVYYEGLKNRCFFCKAEGHMKVECPKLASLRVNAETGGQRSYSSVAANLAIANNSSNEPNNTTLTKTTLPVPPLPQRSKNQTLQLEGDGNNAKNNSPPVKDPEATPTPEKDPMETPVPTPQSNTMETPVLGLVNNTNDLQHSEATNLPSTAKEAITTGDGKGDCNGERNANGGGNSDGDGDGVAGTSRTKNDGIMINDEQQKTSEARSGEGDQGEKSEQKKRPIEATLSLGSNDSNAGQGKGSSSKKKRGTQGQGRSKGKGREK